MSQTRESFSLSLSEEEEEEEEEEDLALFRDAQVSTVRRPKSATNRPQSPFRACYFAKAKNTGQDPNFKGTMWLAETHAHAAQRTLS